MVFVYPGQIFFGGTDAAGVLYFANALNICHEAYEASLGQFGIDLQNFFAGNSVAVPITHASIDYRRPSYCGDQQQIHLRPRLTSETDFSVQYVIFNLEQQILSQAKTHHVAISTGDRKRAPLPSMLQQWIQKYDVDDLVTN